MLRGGLNTLYPFASARVITQHFLPMVPMIKENLQRELGMRKFSRRWAPHLLSPAQKVACFEASKTILRVLQDAESDDFEGIATGDESWFRYCYPSSRLIISSFLVTRSISFLFLVNNRTM
jgi:hypothetical protein